MLNSNEKPKSKLAIPAPPVALVLAVLLIGHGIVANLFTIPSWIGPVLWVGCFVVFIVWLITGSRK